MYCCRKEQKRCRNYFAMHCIEIKQEHCDPFGNMVINSYRL